MTQGNVRVCQHPLVQHFLTLLRDESCPNAQFRFLVNQIGLFLTYEALRDLRPPTLSLKVETEDRKFEGEFIDSSTCALVALMRTGMTMASTVHAILPNAQVGHAGFKSHPTNDWLKSFYLSVPELEGKLALVYDAGMVTGASVVSVLRYMRERRNADLRRTAIITVITSDQALERVDRLHGAFNIPIYCAAVDSEIRTEKTGYRTLPGAGSFQQRMFGHLTSPEEKYEDIW